MSSDDGTIEELIAYLRDELETGVRAALEAQLRKDDSLRRALIELSTEEAALADWAKVERASATLDDETFAIDPVPETNITRLSSARPLAGWWAAAAMLVISALGFFALNQESPAPIPLSGVAHLVASVDADWQGNPPRPNQSMPAGSYHLVSGSVDLEFADGANVSLSGPAVFTLENAHHIHLKSGNLVARIPDEALGFVVTSPQSEVVDLGTEFGLSVSQQGLTDVHVIDGLVEVLPADTDRSASGVMLSEGQARRFNSSSAGSNEIPVASREELLSIENLDQLGLHMLRGSVRVSERLTASDLRKKSDGRNWIDLITEQRDVEIQQPLQVSIVAPGRYRDFADLQRSLAPGRKLNSYLLHFRPSNLEAVRGVIRFDQPIVAILCSAIHLYDSDALFGIPEVDYPSGWNLFRGLEPNGHPTALNAQATDPDWEPDELILSQDQHTLSIRTFANTERGYDQIRILTLSE